MNRSIYLHLFILLGVLALAFSYSLDQDMQRYEFDEVHMGTKFRIVFYTNDDSTAEKAAKKVFRKIESLDRLLSDYKKQSELNRISRQSGDSSWIPVSPTFFRFISKAQHIARETGGAFDLTVGPYVQHWRMLTRSYEPDFPSKDTLSHLSQSVGYQHIHLNRKDVAVKLLQPYMQLDPGGIAKGFAADEAIKMFRELNIPSALVDAGGDITVADAPPRKKGWNISLNHYSSKNNSHPLKLRLVNASVATSGDLYDHLYIDGQRYSHIIDPQTGVGLTNQSKVTVIAPDGTSADSYASAVSVMGPEKGLLFLQSKEILEGSIETMTDDQPNILETDGFSHYQVK